MGVNPFLGMVMNFLRPQQSIPRTEPETPLEQVNAAVTRENQQNLNLQQQQLHAAVEPESVKPAAAVVVSGNQEISNQELLAMAQKRAEGNPEFHAALMKASIPDDGIKIGISKDTIQKVLTFLQPLLADFRGNLDRFLTKPLDQSLPEYLKKIEPLLGTVIPHIESYITTLSPTTQKILNPANTQATAPNPS
jgi:hypothetical protein